MRVTCDTKTLRCGADASNLRASNVTLKPLHNGTSERGEYNAPVAHYRCTMRSSAQQQPAAHTPASERFVQQNAGRRRHGPVVAAVQKHNGAESCPGLGAFGVARDLQCGRVLPKTDVNATAAAARGGGGWGGGGAKQLTASKWGRPPTILCMALYL